MHPDPYSSLTVSGSYAYNGQGQLSSQSQTVGGTTRTASMTYDLNGALKTITYPAGFTVEYQRNDDGQVTAIKKGSTTLASYAYDTAGRLSTRTLSSGVVTTYSYDGMDRVNQIVVSSGTNTLWAERYGFNAVGERIYTLSGTTGTVGDAYWLDATSQLVGVKYGATGADNGYASATSPASVATWDYDAAGNRKTQVIDSGTTSYTANAINQYTKLEGTAPSVPTYSTRGDLVTKGHWEYDYDASGNLIQAHNTNSNVLAKYWRDAFGHRAVKEVDGSKTLYFNFGTDQLEAYDLTAATTTSTIYEPGIDRPLAEVSDSGTVTFYHQDWLGSVALLSDAIGAKVQSYSYDAWGEVSGFDGTDTPIADTAIDSRWLYTAREFDVETGLYHYRARGYSSGLGRFMQNDPIDFAGGDYNLYRYVANNSVNWSDSLGLCPDDPLLQDPKVQDLIDKIWDESTPFGLSGIGWLGAREHYGFIGSSNGATTTSGPFSATTPTGGYQPSHQNSDPAGTIAGVHSHWTNNANASAQDKGVAATRGRSEYIATKDNITRVNPDGTTNSFNRDGTAADCTCP